MHYVAFVDTEDMNLSSGKRKYTSLLGYCSSKLAQVILTIVAGDLLYSTIVIIVCVLAENMKLHITSQIDPPLSCLLDELS